MYRDETRCNCLFTVSEHIGSLLRAMTNDETLSILSMYANDYNLSRYFTAWERERLHLVEGNEYLIVWRDRPESKPEYLYAVNVTADSYLTAAAELMTLLANKF